MVRRSQTDSESTSRARQRRSQANKPEMKRNQDNYKGRTRPEDNDQEKKYKKFIDKTRSQSYYQSLSSLLFCILSDPLNKKITKEYRKKLTTLPSAEKMSVQRFEEELIEFIEAPTTFLHICHLINRMNFPDYEDEQQTGSSNIGSQQPFYMVRSLQYGVQQLVKDRKSAQLSERDLKSLCCAHLLFKNTKLGFTPSGWGQREQADTSESRQRLKMQGYRINGIKLAEYLKHSKGLNCSTFSYLRKNWDFMMSFIKQESFLEPVNQNQEFSLEPKIEQEPEPQNYGLSNLNDPSRLYQAYMMLEDPDIEENRRMVRQNEDSLDFLNFQGQDDNEPIGKAIYFEDQEVPLDEGQEQKEPALLQAGCHKDQSKVTKTKVIEKKRTKKKTKKDNQSQQDSLRVQLPGLDSSQRASVQRGSQTKRKEMQDIIVGLFTEDNSLAIQALGNYIYHIIQVQNVKLVE